MAKRAMGPVAQPAAGDLPDGHHGARTLIEQAYTRLRDDIVEGRLAPGEKLRVEHLKDRYGVGAGTLREAITRLASDALVVAEGQRGFRASPIAIDDLQDLTALRLHIEIEALRQSIRRGGAAWRAGVEQAWTRLSAVEQPLTAATRPCWEVLNTQFHDALIAAGASAWTLKVLRLLSRHGERYRRYAIALPGQTRDVHAEHRLIVDMALSGQEARAALALEAHIRATPDQLIDAHRRGLPWDQRLA